MGDPGRPLENATQALFERLSEDIRSVQPRLQVEHVARVLSVSAGVAFISGLPTLRANELLLLPEGLLGIASSLTTRRTGVILLGDSGHLREGDAVRRSGRVADVPVGEALLGRIVNAVGQPLDDAGPLPVLERVPVERPAPAIMDRAPVSVPLQTGIMAIDAAVPIGRGQRELILGDRQVGKTSIALDAILNQAESGVISVYCAIGQRASATARVIDTLRRHDALERTIIVVAGGDDPAGLQFIAPYAATSMAEHFMRKGRDVLIVYDDLTRHARAYRELSLLLRRAPGREAFPSDIFYVHSRLLERATHLRETLGGGSLTALPIVETQAQNISAYIPTNLISITDGQIFVSPRLFEKGQLPAVDIGKSVSRVGGKAQSPIFRAIAGELRLAHSQFEELETFSRFSTRLDEDTRRKLVRGRRVREVLKQRERQLLPPAQQVLVLLAATQGILDPLEPEKVQRAGKVLLDALGDETRLIEAAIDAGTRLGDDEREALLKRMREILAESGLLEEGQARGDS